MSGEAGIERRILVGAESFADARAALRIADLLVSARAAEIAGLLMEDPFGFEFGGRAGQRVVTESGQIRDLPSRERLKSLLESDLKAFQRSLSQIAEQRKVTVSFECRRGELISSLCGAAIGTDLLVLGHRYRHRNRGRVLVVAPPSADATEVAALGHDLAHRLGAELVAYPPPPGNVSEDAKTDLGDLLSWVNRINAQAVVLDLSLGPVRTLDDLRQLVIAARCPVLVLGAGVVRG